MKSQRNPTLPPRPPSPPARKQLFIPSPPTVPRPPQPHRPQQTHRDRLEHPNTSPAQVVIKDVLKVHQPSKRKAQIPHPPHPHRHPVPHARRAQPPTQPRLHHDPHPAEQEEHRRQVRPAWRQTADAPKRVQEPALRKGQQARKGLPPC